MRVIKEKEIDLKGMASDPLIQGLGKTHSGSGLASAKNKGEPRVCGEERKSGGKIRYFGGN